MWAKKVNDTSYVQNPSIDACEIDWYFEIIIDDSVVLCDQIIEGKKTVQIKNIPTKSILTNFNKKGDL